MGTAVRTLIVINAFIDSASNAPSMSGARPRKDYHELRRRLDADILDLGAVQQHRWSRVLCRLLGAAAGQALVAWLRAGGYDAVFVDRESTGAIMAGLCRLRRRRPRLVMIGHLLTSRKKQMLLRLLGIRSTLDCLIVHSSIQREAAEQRLGLRPDQVALVPYQTDEHFWRPLDVPMRRQICSAGLEYRDYETLVEAVRGLDVDVVIAAASHWSKHQANFGDLPPNVHIVSLDYAALRNLYAESLFVALPLREVENQAGITTILEAMAMGKAVIVSHTLGQTDVVRDRRRVSRTDPSRATQPDWARSFGTSMETCDEGHTGLYVKPGDVEELRKAIQFLLRHPAEARLMGTYGRESVVQAMGLDHFASRVADLVRGEPVVPTGEARQAIGSAS